MAPAASYLETLQKKAADLRSELQRLEVQIEAEEGILRGPTSLEDDVDVQEPAPVMHHRPSFSMLGGCEGAEEAAAAAAAKPMLRQLSASDEDFSKVIKDHPELKIDPIGAYNHWDRRECAVQNGEEWRQRCTRYMNEIRGTEKAIIPKVIHQIWIGPREPPCLWIDTFRVEYLAKHPAWDFKMWSDEQVAKLPMINEEIYTKEKMWQCKADILRLEFLWHYGGLYVDADMISVGLKSLDPILELGKETGWVIAYEPDTKDKPYSILGNSVIACTPHHPLTLMLILYLKQTFWHKRDHVDVFAVTGPVMYTKCLVDCNMPISLAPQEWLYPAFHYVPNPDAIDYSRFPKCLMFQFGYTCSGLEGYVKSKNRCKKARMCSFHSKKEWPFGGFKELPTVQQVEKDYAAAGSPEIPRVIHQLVLNGVDSPSDPVRWRQYWWDNFKRLHPEFEYKTWTKDQLRGRKWFCANLYVEPFDEQAVTELMLEVLFEEGGYYAPLTSIFAAAGRDPFFCGTYDFIEGSAGVVGSAKGSPGCFRRIQSLYEAGAVGPMDPSASQGPTVLCMGFRDSVVAQGTFKPESKYLGAEQIATFLPGQGDPRLELAALSWAYECQVPCVSTRGTDNMKVAVGEGGIGAKTLFLCDRELLQLSRLRDELPGLVQQLGQNGQSWDLMFVGIEWNTGTEETVLFKVYPGGRPLNAKIVGFLANLRDSRNIGLLRSTLARCVSEDGFDPTALFDAAGQLSIYFGAEKYAGTIEEARIWRSMPLVHRCFNELAGHYPPTGCDRHELHGNLLKGHQWDRLRFEMVLEPTGGIMFRCWNDDNSTNCEMKTNGTTVEWMKIYENHQVRKELQNQPIP